MNKKWTPEHALEGIEERIKRIGEKYQKEVEWHHRENKFYKLGLKKKSLDTVSTR